MLSGRALAGSPKPFMTVLFESGIDDIGEEGDFGCTGLGLLAGDVSFGLSIELNGFPSYVLSCFDGLLSLGLPSCLPVFR